MSQKLQKMLADFGLGSRREMERWISAGRVTVNGVVAQIGDRVTVSDFIVVDGKPIVDSTTQVRSRRVILYHKPLGEICSHRDVTGKGTIFDRLPKVTKGEGRWISIGRLDVNTSGLLLLTTDGVLAHRLMHPATRVEREYAVRVLGKADPKTLDRLMRGVMLEDGVARFEDIVEAAKKDAQGGVNHWYYVVVTEGRNRLVRRLWESQGLKVNRLKRVRYGPIILGSMPKQGQYRELTESEIASLA